MSQETQQQLKSPITGAKVHEVISEKEGRKRGYFDFQFILRYLEDDNEFIKEFKLQDGTRILVQLEKPYLHYKKPTQINHERVLADEQPIEVGKATLAAPVCNMDEGCLSCSG